MRVDSCCLCRFYRRSAFDVGQALCRSPWIHETNLRRCPLYVWRGYDMSHEVGGLNRRSHIVIARRNGLLASPLQDAVRFNLHGVGRLYVDVDECRSRQLCVGVDQILRGYPSELELRNESFLNQDLVLLRLSAGRSVFTPGDHMKSLPVGFTPSPDRLLPVLHP